MTRVLCVELSHAWLFMISWTKDWPAPLSMGFLQAWVVEWVAIPFSRGSSQSRDWTQVSTLLADIYIYINFFLFNYLSYQGNPRILEWVVYPFSRGSSQPKNWTGVSCITGRFFTRWATREACDQDGLNISSACLDVRQSFPNSRALTSFNPWGKITN